MSDFNTYSIEDLEAEIQALTQQQAALKQKKLALHKILDLKIEGQNALRRAENLSDSEKAALLQVLQTEGVGSGEAVSDL